MIAMTFSYIALTLHYIFLQTRFDCIQGAPADSIHEAALLMTDGQHIDLISFNFVFS